MEHCKRTVMMAVGRTQRAWADYTRAAAMEIGISDPYRGVMAYLARQPGANQKNIAEFCNVTTAAINQTLKDMIADGYVEKKTDETDRRYTRLFLTEKGKETAKKQWDILRHSDEVITSVITPEKEAEIIELLDKIHDCIRRDL